MKNNLGTIGTRRKVTGRFYFTPAGQTGALDVGNVVMFKRNLNIDYTEFSKSEDGVVQVFDKMPNKITDGWQLKSNEHGDFNLKTALFAARGDNENQAETNGVTGSITAVKQGRSYYIGARNISNLVVTDPIGGGTYVEGTDYVVRKKSGMITILDGDIADDQDVNLLFDMAAAVYATYTSKVSELTLRGTGRLVEDDQLADASRSEHTFPCTLFVSDRGDNSDKELENTIECLISGQVVSKERLDS